MVNWQERKRKKYRQKKQEQPKPRSNIQNNPYNEFTIIEIIRNDLNDINATNYENELKLYIEALNSLESFIYNFQKRAYIREELNNVTEEQLETTLKLEKEYSNKFFNVLEKLNLIRKIRYDKYSINMRTLKDNLNKYQEQIQDALEMIEQELDKDKKPKKKKTVKKKKTTKRKPEQQKKKKLTEKEEIITKINDIYNSLFKEIEDKSHNEKIRFYHFYENIINVQLGFLKKIKQRKYDVLNKEYNSLDFSKILHEYTKPELNLISQYILTEDGKLIDSNKIARILRMILPIHQIKHEGGEPTNYMYKIEMNENQLQIYEQGLTKILETIKQKQEDMFFTYQYNMAKQQQSH